MTLEEKAALFAYAAHAAIGQKRKYSGDDYFVHPAAVAELVRGVPHTEEMLATAYLHDVVEDTAVTLEDIERHFGPKVRELVGWVTDVSRPEHGNRRARKRLDREHLAEAPGEAQTVKLADLIDNSRTITQDPGFGRVWMREMAALVDVLTRGDPGLLERARTIAADYRQRRQERE